VLACSVHQSTAQESTAPALYLQASWMLRLEQGQTRVRIVATVFLSMWVVQPAWGI
jgi:hypothetical protein